MRAAIASMRRAQVSTLEVPHELAAVTTITALHRTRHGSRKSNGRTFLISEAQTDCGASCARSAAGELVTVGQFGARGPSG